jgi:hypothetical protein
MHPAEKPMSLPLRLVLWFVVANAYAGAVSLIVFPSSTQSTFFWSITPPINAGLFGVLYLAAGSFVLHVVLRGRWESARALTAMVPAFTGLMLLTTLLHRDKFDPGLELAYWLLVYVVAPVAAVAFYVQHERRGATWRASREPLTPAARAAAVSAGAGAALFAAGAYFVPELVAEHWPWAISPLMVRVFLSWVAAFAVGLLWFAVDREWSRLRPVAVLLVATAPLLLLMLVLHRGDLRPEAAGAWWAFGAAVVLIGLLGGFLQWQQHAHRSGDDRRSTEVGPEAFDRATARAWRDTEGLRASR